MTLAVVPVVPEISRFFGIVVAMFSTEHGPPHVHAECAGDRASVEIETGRVRGDIPPNARRLVVAWVVLHRDELTENWRLMRAGLAPHRIAPLE